MQEEQIGEASQRITSKGPAEAEVKRSPSEAAMPEGAASPGEMAVDLQAPAPSGTVTAQRTAALPLSASALSTKGFRNTEA